MPKGKYRKIEVNSFYCMGCGKKAMECVRPQAHRRESFHRKKLYCPWCKTTANCVECKNDEEVFEFKQAFENGEFQEEYEISKEECDKYE